MGERSGGRVVVVVVVIVVLLSFFSFGVGLPEIDDGHVYIVPSFDQGVVVVVIAPD